MENTGSQFHSLVDEFYDIKGVAYRVQFVDEIEDEKGKYDVDAICDTKEKVISIKKGLGDRRIDEVLTHELGHAILAEVGLHQTSLNEDLEEIIVEAFATSLTSMFYLVKRKVYNKLSEDNE